jgi:spermidine synthase
VISKLKNWFIDEDSQYRWIYHRVKKHILSTKTQFQHVEIIDTCEFGRVVILDNKIQSAEADEFIYHETLVHPAMITHPNPESVLILGGGEGATSREVFKHPSVRKVTMVDIDKEFVDLCKRYLKKWHKGSLNDSRIELIYDDAFEYIKNIKLKFDVIIADISDPVEKGPAISVYTKKFYSLIKKGLKIDGIFVTHATAMYYSPHKNISIRILKTLTEIFPKVDIYYEYIPSFGTLWTFITGSSTYSPKKISSALINKRIKERKLKNLLYYGAEAHERLFKLPKCIKKLITASYPFML